MHERLAEFQFCKVISHLLSADATADLELQRRFLNKLQYSCYTPAVSSVGNLNFQFSSFKETLKCHVNIMYFLGSLLEIVVFNLEEARQGRRKRRENCRICRRYSCRKHGKKLVFPTLFIVCGQVCSKGAKVTL